MKAIKFEASNLEKGKFIINFFIFIKSCLLFMYGRIKFPEEIKVEQDSLGTIL